MPVSRDSLLFISRLRKDEKMKLMEINSAFAAVDLLTSFRDSLQTACLDRLVRAEGCLGMARQLVTSSDEESIRTAIGRSYYSIHHSLRGMVLWERQWDSDGHTETIDEFAKLLKDKSFLNRASLPPFPGGRRPGECVVETLNNRHVADYSPYDSQREPAVGIVEITGSDWGEAAQFNIAIAEIVYEAAYRIIGS